MSEEEKPKPRNAFKALLKVVRPKPKKEEELLPS